jgi:antibiotic biosynthesis monooxygenase (ABM) superfamily enzyme
MKSLNLISEQDAPSWIVSLQNKKDSEYERTIRFDNYDDAVAYIRHSNKDQFFVNLIEERVSRKTLFHNQ